MKKEQFKLMTQEMKVCAEKHLANRGSCGGSCDSDNCPFSCVNIVDGNGRVNICGAIQYSDILTPDFKANLCVLCAEFLALYKPLKLKDLDWEDSSK